MGWKGRQPEFRGTYPSGTGGAVPSTHSILGLMKMFDFLLRSETKKYTLKSRKIFSYITCISYIINILILSIEAIAYTSQGTRYGIRKKEE